MRNLYSRGEQTGDMKKNDRQDELNKQEDKWQIRRRIEYSLVSFETTRYWVRQSQASLTEKRTQRSSRREMSTW